MYLLLQVPNALIKIGVKIL